jgi:hypothetical protein
LINYDASLRVLPFVVAPSFGQQESLQLRPHSRLAGPLATLVNSLHEYESREKPVNSVVVQSFPYRPFQVVAVSISTAAEEPLSGRRGATLTLGCLVSEPLTNALQNEVLSVCFQAIQRWVGADASVEAVGARIQNAVSLSASNETQLLGHEFIKLCESSFGFRRDPRIIQRIASMLRLTRRRRVESAASLQALILWRSTPARALPPARTRYAMWDAPDRFACLSIGILTAFGVSSGRFDLGVRDGHVIELCSTVASMILIAGSLFQSNNEWAATVRAAAASVCAATWLSLLVARLI